jgi:chorismate mutase
MEKPVTASSLEQIRSEIDDVDRGLLELLERRFAAIEAIKGVKRQASPRTSPMRPAREAKVLRRLHRLRQGHVPVTLMVRLWRSIISAATSLQADVSVHITETIAGDHRLRDMVREHFVDLPLKAEADAERVVNGVVANPLDVGVVESGSQWIEALKQQRALAVIGTLPAIAMRAQVPALLIIGHAKAEATGDDETLVAVSVNTRSSGGVLWEVAAGSYRCLSLRGFLSETDLEFVRLKDAGEASIVGRCPAPLEAGQ